MRIIFPWIKIAEAYNVTEEVAKAYHDYQEKINRTNRLDGAPLQDSMRSKSYRAERMFRQKYGYGPKLTLPEAQSLAEKVFSSSVWTTYENEKHSSKTLPTIEYKKLKTYGGWAYHNHIVLCENNGSNVQVLLHELAHTNGHRDHHQNFRAAHVAFTREFWGKERGDYLEECYKSLKLKCTPFKAKKIKTFEQWYKGYERMKLARASRG